MKKIYVCSRRGRITSYEKYEQLARVYSRMVWDKGYFPITPDLYLPQFLDGFSKAELKAIARLKKASMKQCAEVWVFGTLISKDMQTDIKTAETLNIPVKYFDQYGEPL